MSDENEVNSEVEEAPLVTKSIIEVMLGYLKGNASRDGIVTVVIGLLSYFGYDKLNVAELGLGELMTSALLTKFATIVISVLMARYMLVVMDARLGFNFKEWFKAAPAVVQGQYLSCRILAVMIMVGLIML